MSVGSENYQLVWSEDPGPEASRGPLMGGRWGCSSPLSMLRRVAPIIILASLLVCLFLYYTSPLGATTLYAPSAASETTGLDSATTEVYRKRLRFRGTQRRLPQALIIGVRKCGTRALLEMLNLHPYIQKNGAEMHFFDDDERYANGIEWYRKKMPYSFDNQITMEKTPSYFISREAPARIHAMNTSARLLLIVREPADRVLSDYTQIMESKLRKGIQIAPFHEKILTPDGEIDETYKAIKISQYAIHVLRWLNVFPRDQIHIVDGDKLIADPFSEIDKLSDDYIPAVRTWTHHVMRCHLLSVISQHDMQFAVGLRNGVKRKVISDQDLFSCPDCILDWAFTRCYITFFTYVYSSILNICFQ